jgi:hypothetical protein
MKSEALQKYLKQFEVGAKCASMVPVTPDTDFSSMKVGGREGGTGLLWGWLVPWCHVVHLGTPQEDCCCLWRVSMH